jgi:thioredoxin-like negative regulator of GroEL
MGHSTASNDSSTPDRPIALAAEPALNAFVANHQATLVEFYTEGCGICASMEPVLGGVARTPDLAVGTVNPRDDPPLVERFDVRSVPLFVCFVDGEPVARRADGFISGDELAEWVASKSARSQ